MHLHTAAESGDVDAVAEFLHADPATAGSTNELGWTALHIVAAQGVDTTPAHAKIAQLLLSAGADVNARTPLGWTPIHLIAINGSRESLPVAKQLLSSGADINAVASDGVTDWRVLWQHGKEVRELLESYENSNRK